MPASQDGVQTQNHTAPVAAKDRYVSLDILRGVALMGILMVNVAAFLMYFGAMEYPPAHMDATGANATVWRVTYAFFEMKFITIFSALFGAGILLIVGDEPEASTKLHYSRMIWLLVFGLLHGFLFWFGDILTAYALVGMIAVLFRRMSVSKLLIWGVAAVVLTNLLMLSSEWAGSLNGSMYEPTAFGIVPDTDTLDMWVGAYQSGFWPSRIFNAIGNLLAQMTSIIFFGPRVLGVMLIGMALFKSGFLLARWSMAQYSLTAAVCLIPALPVLWWVSGTIVDNGFAPETMWIAGGVNTFASLVVALGYAAVIMIIAKLPILKLLAYPFAAAGRMAFTNYLTQTFAMVYIATGLGLFGALERVEQAQYVMLIWLAQLIISPLWLLVFRFGPFEWLWRTLSYRKVQPILKARG